MGGHALKSITTERKTTKQFLDISERLVKKLEEIFGTELYVLKFYRSKPDHGDMDILLKVDHNFYNKGINLRKEVEKHLNPTEVVTNDGTVSFDFENFQIDLSPVAESKWEATKFWMDYDPSSNLLGKLFHKFGLKYAPDGLLYPYRGDGGRVIKDIVITKDFRKMMEFVGLDPERKYIGFDTLEEIFDWIISSKYFNPELFMFENLNQTDRKRNRKRPTFNKFIEYIKDFKFESEGYNFERNKDLYRGLIAESFPEANLLEEIEKLEIKDKLFQETRIKFNGELVMEWTGLLGKDLGDVITRYKKERDDDFFKNNSAEDIKLDFANWFEDLKPWTEDVI